MNRFRRRVAAAVVLAALLAGALACCRPAAATESGRRIVVSVADQRAYFIEDGYLVKVQVVSTGRDDSPTPPGTYSIYRHQYEYWTGHVYQYWSMFFHGLYAMHSVLYRPGDGAWIGVDTLGRKASNGCIRESLDDSKWAYDWAPDGTRLDVILEPFSPPPPLPAPAAGGHVALGAGAPSCRWYFAEGCTGGGFDEFIAICNPGTEDATVCLTASRPGEPGRDGWLVVPPGSRRTIRVDEMAPDSTSVVASLRSDRRVVAERSQYFQYHDGPLGGTVAVGARRPAALWLFAEGSCRPGITSYVCVFNPGERAESARVTFMTGSGEQERLDVMVEPGSRATIDARSVLGEGDDAAHDFSFSVESAGGGALVVERPMYYEYQGGRGLGGLGRDGGDVAVGANGTSPKWYFAEGTCRPGFDAYVCVQNPLAADTVARVTFMLGDGRSVSRDLEVPGRSRRTIRANDLLGEGDDPSRDFSCLVESLDGAGLVAERKMYFSYRGGHDLGWEGGHGSLGAPEPLARWYFAEGTCRPSFDTYLTVLNPAVRPARAEVRFMLGDGGRVERVLDLPGLTRTTLKVNDVLGQANDAAHDFSCLVEGEEGATLVVERPMYFLFDRR